MNGKNVKHVCYSEGEAATRLGISVPKLRELISSHIADGAEVPPASRFQASDLILLRVLAGLQADAPAN